MDGESVPWEREKKKNIYQANSSDPSAKSHMLLAHTVHAPMYTQANTHTHTFRYRMLAVNSVNTPLIPYYCNLPLINAPQR